MIPISLILDTREKVILMKWNGFFSFAWKNGRRVKTIFRIPIPHRFGAKRETKTHLPQMRWTYLKEFFSFLRKWELRRVEGTLSFQDPMVNGILYGWLSVMGARKENRAIDLTVNFLGENWCSGEATVSPKVAFHCLKRWISCFLRRVKKW
jgi:hypothetical protein